MRLFKMKLYYYYLTMKNEQIFAEVDIKNYSEIKIKNTICKEVVARMFTKEELNKITKEDISNLKKNIKKRIYNTMHLLEGKINIEVYRRWTLSV